MEAANQSREDDEITNHEGGAAAIERVWKVLSEQGLEGKPETMQTLLNEAMKLARSEAASTARPRSSRIPRTRAPYVSPYAASKHTTYSELARAGWDLLALPRMGRRNRPEDDARLHRGVRTAPAVRHRRTKNSRNGSAERIVWCRFAASVDVGQAGQQKSQQQDFGAATSRNQWEALVGVVGFEPTTLNTQSSGSSH